MRTCPIMSKSGDLQECLRSNCQLWDGDLEICEIQLISERLGGILSSISNMPRK